MKKEPPKEDPKSIKKKSVTEPTSPQPTGTHYIVTEPAPPPPTGTHYIVTEPGSPQHSGSDEKPISQLDARYLTGTELARFFDDVTKLVRGLEQKVSERKAKLEATGEGGFLNAKAIE